MGKSKYHDLKGDAARDRLHRENLALKIRVEKLEAEVAHLRAALMKYSIAASAALENKVEKFDMKKLNGAIWCAIMEFTAGVGWTDNARNMLVKNVQDTVAWALGREDK